MTTDLKTRGQYQAPTEVRALQIILLPPRGVHLFVGYTSFCAKPPDTIGGDPGGRFYPLESLIIIPLQLLFLPLKCSRTSMRTDCDYSGVRTPALRIQYVERIQRSVGSTCTIPTRAFLV